MRTKPSNTLLSISFGGQRGVNPLALFLFKVMEGWDSAEKARQAEFFPGLAGEDQVHFLESLLSQA